MHAEPEAVVPLDLRPAIAPAVAFGVVAALIAGTAALYWGTTASMVAIWARSETFTHGFLVLPACLWFVWRRRAALAATPLRPFWPGLLGAAAASLLWLLGELSGSLAPTHFALYGMVAFAVLTVCGVRWFRLLAFPLAVLFFAVPFGEAFVPVLIDWTADFTVAALQVTGVPVLREGNDLTIPSGRWSVVDACSGVRYLLASVMSGLLFAGLMYRSPLRRATFVAASIGVPIVANWLRAYLIVMLGHLTDNRVAAGVDHLIYGWVFFGAVILLMFWVGARWREDAPPRQAKPTPSAAMEQTPRDLMPAIAASFAILLAPLLANAALTAGRATPPLPAVLALEGQNGWRPAVASDLGWRPTLVAARARYEASFEKEGRSVSVHIGVYRDQRQGAEAVSSQNRPVGAAAPGWSHLTAFRMPLALGAHRFAAEGAELRSPAGDLTLVRFYWAPERVTASDTRAKIGLALDRLLGRDDLSAWVAIATANDPLRPAEARAALEEFLADMGHSLEQALRSLSNP
jgi:exosortase A